MSRSWKWPSIFNREENDSSFLFFPSFFSPPPSTSIVRIPVKIICVVYMIHLDQDANKMLEARKKSGQKRKKGTERTQAVSKIGLATRNNVVEVAVVGY